MSPLVTELPGRHERTPSAAGRGRMLARGERPLFTSDWDRAVFLHWRVEPRALAPEVPFELDLHEGAAWVSLVAFTMRRLRPTRGGFLGRIVAAPLATHGFLNVRTYVRCGEETGIYFLAEWLPNPLAVLLGPRLFGLPYRRGRLDYRHDLESGRIAGEVRPADTAGWIEYQSSVPRNAPMQAAAAGSTAEFLLERYTAFTQRGSRRRRFRVWHPPWPHVPVDATVGDHGLLAATGDWCRGAEFAGAHVSPGVGGVWIGPARGLLPLAKSVPTRGDAVATSGG